METKISTVAEAHERDPLTPRRCDVHADSDEATVKQVAADLDGDTFTMEESEDGQRIAATWVGTLVAGHCGRRLDGVRLGEGGAATEGPAFRLQRR